MGLIQFFFWLPVPDVGRFSRERNICGISTRDAINVKLSFELDALMIQLMLRKLYLGRRLMAVSMWFKKRVLLTQHLKNRSRLRVVIQGLE